MAEYNVLAPLQDPRTVLNKLGPWKEKDKQLPSLNLGVGDSLYNTVRPDLFHPRTSSHFP